MNPKLLTLGWFVCRGFHPYLGTAWYVRQNYTCCYLNAQGDWAAPMWARSFWTAEAATDFAWRMAR
jgi:hypothetical protein